MEKTIDEIKRRLTEIEYELTDLLDESYMSGYVEGFAKGYGDTCNELHKAMCTKCHTAKLDDCYKCEWKRYDEQ